MSNNENKLFSAELTETIMQILKRGNTAELKREQGKLVLVEIQRKMKSKTSIIG